VSQRPRDAASGRSPHHEALNHEPNSRYAERRPSLLLAHHKRLPNSDHYLALLNRAHRLRGRGPGCSPRPCTVFCERTGFEACCLPAAEGRLLLGIARTGDAFCPHTSQTIRWRNKSVPRTCQYIGLLGKGVIAIAKTQGSVDEWRTPFGRNLKAALLVSCAVSPGLPSLVTWR
jgi:hypothetical protein